jgi:methionyl-tRNA formyltransferase
MKTAVIGGVGSTALLVRKLSEHGYREVRVWGYHPPDCTDVSGWSDVVSLAEELGFEGRRFVRVTECLRDLGTWGPDVIFAVGLSQLIPEAMIRIPAMGCIGFHPTRLPLGRGRAPLAWIVEDGVPAAASFFRIGEGVDDGPILAQEAFEVVPEDDALAVSAKLMAAMSVAVDRLLPALLAGNLVGQDQDHARATWYGRRTPADGIIDWERDAGVILRKIRAASMPHPGAFTFAGDEKVIIWKAQLSSEPITGVPGRIVAVDADGGFQVQSGGGVVRVVEWVSGDWKPRVGQRLGFSAQWELSRLRGRCASLEARLAELERRCGNASEETV